MRLLVRISVVLLLMGAGTSLLALQRGGYQDDEFGSARQRMEGNESGESKSEYSWSRLRYTAANSSGYGYGRWSSWSRDYPKADR